MLYFVLLYYVTIKLTFNVLDFEVTCPTLMITSISTTSRVHPLDYECALQIQYCVENSSFDISFNSSQMSDQKLNFDKVWHVNGAVVPTIQDRVFLCISIFFLHMSFSLLGAIISMLPRQCTIGYRVCCVMVFLGFAVLHLGERAFSFFQCHLEQQQQYLLAGGGLILCGP